MSDLQTARIDLVAEAIWQTDELWVEQGFAESSMPTWADLNEGWQQHYRRMARAAIDALKEPFVI